MTFILNFIYHFSMLRINSQDLSFSKARVIKVFTHFTICTSHHQVQLLSSPLRFLLNNGIHTLVIHHFALFIKSYLKIICPLPSIKLNQFALLVNLERAIVCHFTYLLFQQYRYNFYLWIYGVLPLKF